MSLASCFWFKEAGQAFMVCVASCVHQHALQNTLFQTISSDLAVIFPLTQLIASHPCPSTRHRSNIWSFFTDFFLSVLRFSSQSWLIQPSAVPKVPILPASWEKARARSGRRRSRRRGNPSPWGTGRHRATAPGAAAPSAACGPKTAWWAPSAAGRSRSPAWSPCVERASACGCVSEHGH